MPPRAALPRGRKSKVDNPEVIAMVERALQDVSQPSSRLSWSPAKQEWLIASWSAV